MCSINKAKCADCPNKAGHKNRITLVERPNRMAICETKMHYDVVLNGEVKGALYFNMTGYVGTLPLCGCGSISIGEKPLSEYRKEIARINRGE